MPELQTQVSLNDQMDPPKAEASPQGSGSATWIFQAPRAGKSLPSFKSSVFHLEQGSSSPVAGNLGNKQDTHEVCLPNLQASSFHCRIPILLGHLGFWWRPTAVATSSMEKLCPEAMETACPESKD